MAIETRAKYLASPPTLNDNQFGDLLLDNTGRLQTNVTGIIPNTGATNLGKAEDAAHASGDTGVFVLGVRNDSAAGLTNADLDYSPIAVDSTGAIRLGQASTGSSGIGKQEDAPHSTGDVGVMLLGVRNDTNASATSASGDYGYLQVDPTGSVINKPYAPSASDWQYAAAASGIVNTTTAVTFKAAAGAGIRNYITGIDIMSEALTNATELVIRDGAAGTVIWRTKIGTGGLTGGRHIHFATPLKGTANTLLEVATLSASGAGAVYFNAQGYVGP